MRRRRCSFGYFSLSISKSYFRGPIVTAELFSAPRSIGQLGLLLTRTVSLYTHTHVFIRIVVYIFIYHEFYTVIVCQRPRILVRACVCVFYIVSNPEHTLEMSKQYTLFSCVREPSVHPYNDMILLHSYDLESVYPSATYLLPTHRHIIVRHCIDKPY